MMKFGEFVGDCGIIDSPFSNRKFTSSSGREVPAMDRLDRFF